MHHPWVWLMGTACICHGPSMSILWVSHGYPMGLQYRLMGRPRASHVISYVHVVFARESPTDPPRGWHESHSSLMGDELVSWMGRREVRIHRTGV